MVYEPGRTTWANKATPGFYLGPALQHYCSSRIYNPETGHERIPSCFQVFPTKVRLPGSSRADSFEEALAKAITTDSQSTALIETAKQLLTTIQRHPLAVTVVLEQDTTPVQRVQACPASAHLAQSRVLRSHVAEPNERVMHTPTTTKPAQTPDADTQQSQRVK